MELYTVESQVCEDERGRYRSGNERFAVADSILDFDGTVAGVKAFKAAMYKFGMREYGRCTGKVYVDVNGRTHPAHVGWVFVKREKYEDSPHTYLQETWFTVEQHIDGRFLPFRFDEPNAYEGC